MRCYTEPPPAGEECPFCPEGLAVAPDFSLSTGDGPPGSCGGVVSLALKMNLARDKCIQARAVERLCCLAGAGDDPSTAAVPTTVVNATKNMEPAATDNPVAVAPEPTLEP